MKKALCRLLPAMLFAALPAAVFADTSVDSTTILRFQQEAQSTIAGTADKTLVPLTQYLGVDTDKLGDGNLSFHFFGWGRIDLAERRDDTGNVDRSLDGKLTYGYLQYRFNNANARIRLGRSFINEGIVNEQIDGVSARTDLPFGLGLSAFGGATVHTRTIPGAENDGKGDGIFGGRLNYRLGGRFELGVSGVFESTAPTPVVPRVLAGSFGSHRLVGGDIWLRPIDLVQLSGHSSYNTETRKFAEHSYMLQLFPIKNLVVTGTFDEHHDRDYFYSSPLFVDMLQSLSQESKVYGGSATYSYKKIEFTGDYKRYTRDIGRADRFGGDVRGNFLENSFRTGVAYHYLRASSNFAVVPIDTASGSYHEVRGWAMHDTKNYFASLDVIDYIFKKTVENRDSAWEILGSVGYHFTPALALSGDVSYGQNPQYQDEVRGLLRLTYNMKTAKGGAK